MERGRSAILARILRLSGLRDEGDVRQELVASLFENTVPIAIMSATAAGVGALIAADLADPWLWPLLALVVATAAARMAIVWAHRVLTSARPLDEQRVIVWERAYAAGSFGFAASLGAFAARAVLSHSPTDDMLVVALLFGYGSGLVSRVSLRPWICVPSLAFATAPPILVLLCSGIWSQVAVGGVLALFAIGSLETVSHTHRALARNCMARRALLGLARHDALTGLPNRILLGERLDRAFARQRREGGSLALHVIDLDGFKGVNDGWGHPTGDLLLKAVAQRLSGLLRPDDVAARLGGDEFVVLQPAIARAGEAELLARRIARALQAPYSLDGLEITIGASVGLALSPDHADGATGLVAAADAALYRAKARGRNRVVTAAEAETALAS